MLLDMETVQVVIYRNSWEWLRYYAWLCVIMWLCTIMCFCVIMWLCMIMRHYAWFCVILRLFSTFPLPDPVPLIQNFEMHFEKNTEPIIAKEFCYRHGIISAVHEGLLNVISLLELSLYVLYPACSCKWLLNCRTCKSRLLTSYYIYV